ncbi:MAG: DNA/RNA nuclease SfsA [Lachnospiraceae bacterium]|nr:DNA/RNA nuclease SfsA [Lachnospiraceae bacterium]
MRYENMEPAQFLERPNRFIAWVQTQRGKEICHVKNTGRCRELLLPGAALYVQRNENPSRKTPLDLIAVRKGERLINMDSQAPNRVVEEWLRQGGKKGKDMAQGEEKSGLCLCTEKALIRPEYRYKDSRFDFLIKEEQRRILLEVKGVTLEEEGIVRFPDAPTQRGVKHIRELMDSLREGYEACIFFVVQMKGVKYLEPNDKTHREFGDALREAREAGVRILAYDCQVEPDLLEIQEKVPVKL